MQIVSTVLHSDWITLLLVNAPKFTYDKVTLCPSVTALFLIIVFTTHEISASTDNLLMYPIRYTPIRQHNTA